MGLSIEQRRQYARSLCIQEFGFDPDELRRDAARYRWLKSRTALDLRSGHGEWRRIDGTTFIASHYLAEGHTQHAPAESLDATIDAAMLVADMRDAAMQEPKP